MTWFYATGSERFGPVTAADLAQIGRGGGIGPDDLVWHDGLSDWQPFRLAASGVYTEAGGGDPALPIQTAVCAHSLRVLPVSELMPYGEQWVDPAHKDAFVQQLMEGAKNPAIRDYDAPGPVYVGFWWRFLGYFIDNMVVMVPSLVCMIPYYIAMFSGGFATGAEAGGQVWTGAMIITYIFGILGQFAISGGYHTWMIVKYQGTVGKMTIGAKVVAPDGGRITAGRAFCRWLCFYWLNGIIVMICTMIGAFLGALILGSTGGFGGDPSENPALFFTGIMAVCVLGGGGFLLGMFPFWMAGRDAEKRALHDRICATRVVKK